MIDIATPISTVTAQEILLPLLPVNGSPDLVSAAQLADRLMREHGMFCTVEYILDVWTRKAVKE